MWLLSGEHVAGCGDELSLVLCTSVANDNLGGVFVGHHDGWTRKSAAMSISIISHQRLPNHTSMQSRSNFECIRGHRSGFTGAVLVWVVSFGDLREGKGDSFTVLHQDRPSSGDSSVLEGGI